MKPIKLRFSDGRSDKFWEVSVKGSSYTVRYGRTGTTGQATTKTAGSSAKAATEAQKLANAKLRRGYEPGGKKSTQPGAKKSEPKATTAAKERAKKLAAKSGTAKAAPIAKVALVRERISRLIAEECGYFVYSDFIPVRFFDWGKVTAKHKAEFWSSVLGDVGSGDDFPGIVEVSYEETRHGRAVKARWRDERWMPIAVTNPQGGGKAFPFGQVDHLVCADLEQASTKKVPLHVVSIDGTLVRDFHKLADDFTKLDWVRLSPLGV